MLRLTDCTVDLVRALVCRDDAETPLTAREVDLLAYLARREGTDVSREDLLVNVWGYRPDMLTRTVDNTVRRLRSKIEVDASDPLHVITVFGVGYRFEPVRDAAARRSGSAAVVWIRRTGGDATAPGSIQAGARSELAALLGEELPAERGGPDPSTPAAAAVLPDAGNAAALFARLDTGSGAVPSRGTLAAGIVQGELGDDEATAALADRARQLAALAHAGQALVDGEAWPPAGGTPADLVFEDAGFVRLAGEARPTRLVSVVGRERAGRGLPPLLEADARRSNLPSAPTRFIGRGADLRRLRDRKDARLVTVVGTGGTGKTRLALQYAERALQTEAPAGGVWLCELATARSTADVVRLLADALGTRVLTEGEGGVRQVAHALAARGPTLVVLDNLEQLVPTIGPTLCAWLELAPQVGFLATSREPVGVALETVVELGPLDAEESLALFVDRARSVHRGFVLHPDEEPVVRAVIAKLDGIPLAIELAAARSRVLRPAALLERLAHRFDTLARGPRDGQARHATLRNAIDWSWDLLDDAERSALAQLSVFRGGCAQEAPEEVVSIDRPVAEVVTALVGKSLLRRGAGRLSMYESIHDYAVEKLGDDAGSEAVHRRHAAWVLARGGRLSARIGAERGSTASRELAVEQANLLAAHAWAVRHDAGLAAGLAEVIETLLGARGPVATLLRVLADTLDMALPPAERARVLTLLARTRLGHSQVLDAVADASAAVAAARAAASEGDPSARRREAAALVELGRGLRASQHRLRSTAVLEAAGALARAEGDRRLAATIAIDLAEGVAEQGRLGEAIGRLRVALSEVRALGEVRGEARVLVDLGELHEELGQWEQAHEAYGPALEIVACLGDRRLEGAILASVAEVHLERGRHDSALDHLEVALDVLRPVGARRVEGMVLATIGAVYQDRGEVAAAREQYERARAVLREAGDRRQEGDVLGRMAGALLEEGRAEEALEVSRTALHVLREVGDRRQLGALIGRMALLVASLGHPEEAARACRLAREHLAAAGDEVALRVVAAVECSVTDGPAAAIAELTAPGAAGPLVERSVEARHAWRVLRGG